MSKKPIVNSFEDPALKKTTLNQVRNTVPANAEQKAVKNTSITSNATTVNQQVSATTPATTGTTAGTTSGGVQRIIETPDGTVIVVSTDKEVIVNTFEEVTEQKFINNISGGGGGQLQVGLATGSTYSNVVSDTTKIGFDASSFAVSQIGQGIAKVSLTASGYSGWSGAGSSGYSGALGSSGFSGIAGAFAGSGYSGSIGASGFSGFSGRSGFSGVSGSGASGFSGRSGYSGAAFVGSSGFSGISGRSGLGTSGYSGANGSTGASGYSGAAFVGSSGFSGISGISGESGFSGEPGSSGFSGIGTSGYSGADGSAGASGYSGEAFVGSSGFSGISGLSGYSSDSGFSGESGSSGFSGQPGGLSGYSGIAGAFSASGYSGFIGESGFSGLSGFSGIGDSGYSGVEGISGYSGISGYDGQSGYSGEAGASGYSGEAGASGYSGVGVSGAAGESGFSGETGASGYSGVGVSGYSGEAGAAGASGFSGQAGGGGGSPGGSSGYVQYNDGGVFGGNSGFTYDDVGNIVGLQHIANPTAAIDLTVGQTVTDSWASNVYLDPTSFLYALSTAIPTNQTAAVAVDSTGNIWTLGSFEDSSQPVNDYVWMYSVTPGGILANNVSLAEVGTTFSGTALHIDTGDNKYVGLLEKNALYQSQIVKLDSINSIVWSTKLVGTTPCRVVEMKTDSTGELYVLIANNTAALTEAVLVKINKTSGAITWQRRLTGLSGVLSTPMGLTIDSSDNIYLSTSTVVISNRFPVIAKYNSSGVIQWQKQFTGVASDAYAGPLSIDASGNIYFILVSDAGFFTYQPATQVLVVIDSSGAILLQKGFPAWPGPGPESVVGTIGGLIVDASSNIYVLSNRFGVQFLVKYNSTGDVVWSNTISASIGNLYSNYLLSESSDPTGSLSSNLAQDATHLIVGFTFGNTFSNYTGVDRAYTLRLPKDGTGLGPVANYLSYSPVTVLTPSVSTLGIATSSMTEAVGLLTTAASSVYSAGISYSTQIYPITGTNVLELTQNGKINTPVFDFPTVLGNPGEYLRVPTGAFCIPHQLEWSNPLSLSADGNFLTSCSPLTYGSSSNIGIGGLSVNNGFANVAIGIAALGCSYSDSANTAIGYGAMCVFNAGGLFTDNTAVGIGAMGALLYGYKNTAVGSSAGGATCCGSDNIFIGNFTGGPTPGFSILNNNIVIGTCAITQTATSSNEIVIGTTAYLSQYAPSATWSALSDVRDKTAIQDINLGLDFIRDLRPVKFTWQDRDGNRTGLLDSGFIAQDLLDTSERWGVSDWLRLASSKNPEKLHADPGRLIPVIVRAIQELADEVDRLKALVDPPPPGP